MRKILTTKNYKLFNRSTENRPFDVKKHGKLVSSMQRYGFLPCFPIVCFLDPDGKLVIKDGQHRAAIAETLGLQIHYVVEETDFDIALVNSTAKVWALGDYAKKFAENGNGHYRTGLEFRERHKLPIGTAFALLAGTTGFGNCCEAFVEGTWKVKDLPWAEAVANVYGPLVEMSPAIKNARFIEACMAACRVKEFDEKRMLACAKRCREKLVGYSTRDAYLDMMEEVYNFGRKDLLGLKTAAIMAMRERNGVLKKKKAAAETAGVAS